MGSDIQRQRRPRSRQSCHGLKPLKAPKGQGPQPANLFAAGRRLQQQPSASTEASLLLHGSRRSEGQKTLEALLSAMERGVRSPAECSEVINGQLSECVELRRLVEGAGDLLQGKDCQIFLPQAAEHIIGSSKSHASTRPVSAVRGQTLRSVDAPVRRKPPHGCSIAWSTDNCENSSPDRAGDAGADEHGLRCKRSGSRPGSRGQSNAIVWRGRGPEMMWNGTSEAPINEITAKLGGIGADISLDGASAQSCPDDPEGKQRLASIRSKRSLVCSTDGDAKFTREHLVSPSSLGFWASQSPTLASNLAAESPVEGSLSGSGNINHCYSQASSPMHLAQSSPRVAKGRPPLSKAQSTPQLTSDGLVNYFEICHSVGGGGDSASDAIDYNTALGVSCGHAGKRGMALGTCSGPLSPGGVGPSDNMFGLMSRSTTPSQGPQQSLAPLLLRGVRWRKLRKRSLDRPLEAPLRQDDHAQELAMPLRLASYTPAPQAAWVAACLQCD